MSKRYGNPIVKFNPVQNSEEMHCYLGNVFVMLT